jgi:endonuclease/exonuclease/phosphatase family metal-dependent hydrolase
MKKVIYLLPFLFLACGTGKKTVHSVSRDQERVTSDEIISVMSFNIRSCRPIGKKVAEVDSTAAAIIRQHPDIVFLQEVDNGTRRSLGQDQAKQLAEKTGLLNYYFVKGIIEDGGEFGDAIITRFPIVEKRGLLLPKVTVKGRYVEQRVLNMVTLKLPSGATVCAACSHFDLTQENRTLQAYEVIKELSAVHQPVIFAADLNDHVGSKTLNILDSVFLRTCKSDCNTFPVPVPKTEIDFIMYRSSDHISVISHEVCLKEDYASDHFPVVAKIKCSLPGK